MLRLVVLLFAVSNLAWASGEFVGRWDVTEKIGDREYAAWIEITQDGPTQALRSVLVCQTVTSNGVSAGFQSETKRGDHQRLVQFRAIASLAQNLEREPPNSC